MGLVDAETVAESEGPSVPWRRRVGGWDVLVVVVVVEGTAAVLEGGLVSCSFALAFAFAFAFTLVLYLLGPASFTLPTTASAPLPPLLVRLLAFSLSDFTAMVTSGPTVPRHTFASHCQWSMGAKESVIGMLEA